MGLENPFRRDNIRDRIREIPLEERVKIEQQTLREEIEALRSQLDELERDFEKLALARAKGVPYSYEMKRGLYKDWK